MNAHNPSPELPPSSLNDRVADAVRSHRAKINVLTSVAFLVGFLTVATSVFLVWCYLILYLPKQKSLLLEAERAFQQSRANPPVEQVSVQDAVKRIDQLLGAQITLTHVVSMGTTAVAIGVGVLGLGSLVLLTVVILNRRVTLNQINASLAQISGQFKELHSQKTDPGTRPGT